MIVNTLIANSLEQLNERLVVANNANTLIFAFASTDIDHFSLYDLLTRKGYIAVTSSSGGQFAGGELLYYGISCMVLELPENSFKLKRYDNRDDFFDMGKELGQYVKATYENADVLLFANSGADIDHEAILTGLQQVGDGIGVFGGLAIGSQKTHNNFIGIAGAVSEQAIGAVIFDTSKIAIEGIVVGGWEAVGTYKTVTKSIGKKVYELDNKPIKQVYQEYFDHQEDSSVSRYLEFPIQVLDHDSGAVIRSLADIGEDSFCYSGNISQGSKIYFCSPSITKTVSSSINEINEFQKANQLMDSDAILAFSCNARLHSFGFYIQNEIRSFNEMWGVKHAGFFTHGEIGRCNSEYCNNSSARLHNNSISIVFFKDLTVAHSPLDNSKNIHYHEHEIEITDVLDKNKVIAKLQEQKLALSNLLQRTSLDLNNALHELDQYKSGLEQKVDSQLADIKKLNKEITDTQKEVIFTMGSIAETRSKETGHHVIRVAEYSRAFILLLGLGEERAELIKQASPMHDIGKVGIPDAILNKPGKLTEVEFEKMKTHAELGYKMLNHSKRPILQVAAMIAREHHEKWDGTGYPQGLMGGDIHIYGRVTAIADVFDALGSERCYKKAWEDKDIYAYFKAQRGKQFDPELIDIFFDHIEIFKEIRDKYKDV